MSVVPLSSVLVTTDGPVEPRIRVDLPDVPRGGVAHRRAVGEQPADEGARAGDKQVTLLLHLQLADGRRDVASQDGRPAHDGSVRLVETTYPLVVGQGTRLFPELGADMAPDLVGSRTSARGITIQSYRPAGRPEYAPA
jgi:hypothetical protein